MGVVRARGQEVGGYEVGNCVAAMQDTVTKLYRRVAEVEMKAKVEEKCGLSKDTRSRGSGSGKGAIGPPYFTSPSSIWRCSWCDPITRWFLVLDQQS